jgi:hypothetical protein
MDRDELAAFEREAEILVTHQLDLIAQLERQLRGIHRTMRQIERLRGAKHRQGPELSNGEKGETLNRLAVELTAIDTELGTQHESCLEMQATIGQMRARLRALQQPSNTSQTDGPESASPTG